MTKIGCWIGWSEAPLQHFTELHHLEVNDQFELGLVALPKLRGQGTAEDSMMCDPRRRLAILAWLVPYDISGRSRAHSA
jgi:hypothetical protein